MNFNRNDIGGYVSNRDLYGKQYGKLDRKSITPVKDIKIKLRQTRRCIRAMKEQGLHS